MPDEFTTIILNIMTKNSNFITNCLKLLLKKSLFASNIFNIINNSQIVITREVKYFRHLNSLKSNLITMLQHNTLSDVVLLISYLFTHC